MISLRKMEIITTMMMKMAQINDDNDILKIRIIMMKTIKILVIMMTTTLMMMVIETMIMMMR